MLLLGLHIHTCDDSDLQTKNKRWINSSCLTKNFARKRRNAGSLSGILANIISCFVKLLLCLPLCLVCTLTRLVIPWALGIREDVWFCYF